MAPSGQPECLKTRLVTNSTGSGPCSTTFTLTRARTHTHTHAPRSPAMVRAKGKAAAKSRTTPTAAIDGPLPEMLTAAIPVEDPPSASAPSSEDTEQSKKKQKKVANEKRAEKTSTVAELDKSDRPKNKDGAPYERGTALLKKYWEGEIPSLVPKDTDIDTLKNAVSTMRKVAISELEKKGAFTIHGICSIRVVHRKGRDAGRLQLFGQPVDVKARPPHKKLLVKSARCLQDSVCKEMNNCERRST